MTRCSEVSARGWRCELEARHDGVHEATNPKKVQQRVKWAAVTGSSRTVEEQKCGLCGKNPAAGFASINATRYCHGDDDPEPTCYMRASLSYAMVSLTDLPPALEVLYAAALSGENKPG